MEFSKSGKINNPKGIKFEYDREFDPFYDPIYEPRVKEEEIESEEIKYPVKSATMDTSYDPRYNPSNDPYKTEEYYTTKLPDDALTSEDVFDTNVPSIPGLTGNKVFLGKIPLKDDPRSIPKYGKTGKTPNLIELRNKLSEIQKQLSSLEGTVPGSATSDDIIVDKVREKVDELKKIKPLEGVETVSNPPFFLLPILSGVDHPLYAGTANAFRVSVGSHDWLRVLDELRAVGWPYYEAFGIEDFLLKSAWIVKQELNYNVIETLTTSKGKPMSMDDYRGFDQFRNEYVRNREQYNNHIEEFVYGYPDPERQRERLRRNYDKLNKDLRKVLGKDYILPRNYTEAPKTYECPPDKEFSIDGTVIKGFLRHWNEVDPKRTVIRPVKGKLVRVPLCTYPSRLRNSWVPKEYREIIERKYNLIQFKYNSENYKSFMYNLLNSDFSDKDRVGGKAFREIDSEGKPFIVIQEPRSRAAYRIYLGKLSLDFSDFNGDDEKDTSLREWLRKYINNLTYAPVIQAILNAPAPRNLSVFNIPASISKQTYTRNYKGKRITRMYADVPLRVFRKQLIDVVLGKNFKAGDDYQTCTDKFVTKMYDYIYAKYSQYVDDFPTDIPEAYQNFLTEFFEFGGIPEQCSVISSIDELTDLTPINDPNPFLSSGAQQSGRDRERFQKLTTPKDFGPKFGVGDFKDMMRELTIQFNRL